MAKTLLEQLDACDPGRLEASEKRCYELLGRSMLTLGRYDEAVTIYSTIKVDMPTHLLIACADRLLAAKQYKAAFVVYKEVNEVERIRAYGIACLEAEQYGLALAAFTKTQSNDLLLQLGNTCTASRVYEHAVPAFKEIGAYDLLLEVGMKCLNESEDLGWSMGLQLALAAFTGCRDRDKLEELGNFAQAIWLKDGEEVAGRVALSSFVAINAKCKLISLGEKAIGKDNRFAFDVLKAAGAKVKLAELGDVLLAAGEWERAAQAYMLADENDKLFQCAVRCVEKLDVHNAFCQVYSYNKLQPPADKFMQYATELLERGEEKLASDIFRELAYRCGELFS